MNHLGLIAAAVTLVFATSAAGETSTLCKFTAGPRAGQTQDYAPMQGLSVGMPCQDGLGSSGHVIHADGRDVQPEAKRPGYSTVCVFNRGARAGQSQDYSPAPALAVGTPCHDGAGSTGVVR